MQVVEKLTFRLQQGSVLGPTLFLVCINELSALNNSSQTQMTLRLFYVETGGAQEE